ncbi:hypothetical protein [Hydrogenimonas urashimensis]|uniref:hypothetical protein n=1 Tax=Hydrogenimonas urashimensis TaxID=2740515 RepID=UPI00191566FB|nr:hypothetical protein [Hydrogenimonas urashimensis]
MLRILFLIILLIHPLFSAVLLNENLYERENRIDLMLSFDTPFDGEIKKRTEKGGIINILLTRSEIQKPFFQTIRKSFVESIAVTKSGEKRTLVKIVPSTGAIGVQASKTVDGFGLRLRIYPLTQQKRKSAPATATLPTKSKGISEKSPTAAKPLNTLKSDETVPGWRYWSVLALLLLLLLILWFVKKKGVGGLAKGGWLMPGGGPLAQKLPEEAVIRFQKPLDASNRLLLIEFGKKQYLTIVGNTNLLLDRFSAGSIEGEEDFARMFQANKKQLDHFLQENHPDAYEAFKANASKEEHL